jgi:hypothetical protein
MTNVAPPWARTSAPKGWLATFLIILIMVGIVGAGAVAAASLSSVPDKPITIAEGVTIVVPPDWSFGGRSEDRKTILLSRGNASVAISVEEDSDELIALRHLRDEWAAQGVVSVGEIVPVTDARSDGKPAARFAYSGTFPELPGAVEGEVTAVRGNSIAVVFDAWAGEGQFVNARDDVARIIRETTIP